MPQAPLDGRTAPQATGRPSKKPLCLENNPASASGVYKVHPTSEFQNSYLWSREQWLPLTRTVILREVKWLSPKVTELGIGTDVTRSETDSAQAPNLCARPLGSLRAQGLHRNRPKSMCAI